MEIVCKQFNNEDFIDIFIIFGLLIMKIYVSCLFWKRKVLKFTVNKSVYVA